MTCLSFWWNRFQKLLPPQQPQLPQLPRRFHHREACHTNAPWQSGDKGGHLRWRKFHIPATVPMQPSATSNSYVDVLFQTEWYRISNVGKLWHCLPSNLQKSLWLKVIDPELEKNTLQTSRVRRSNSIHNLSQKNAVSSWIKTWDTWHKLSKKVFFKVSSLP